MKNLFLLISFFSLKTAPVVAQASPFVMSGSIVFEKSVNAYGLIKQTIGINADPNMQVAFDKYKESHAQFKKYTSTLTFTNKESLYIPESVTRERILNDLNPLDDAGNITYANLTTGMAVTQKKVYDDIFLIKDRLRNIKWRYTGEMREIAGYACRRANAIIMDSIYVVAFFTDKIHVSGGPESFTGLPGMILGVALPYENVTWFATKVTASTTSANNLTPPNKGKAINYNDFAEFLKQKMKAWGATGIFEQKAFLL